MRRVQLFDPTGVNTDEITLPSNLPAFFTPHFFPQTAGVNSGNELCSIQWQQGSTGQTWTPSVWVSQCDSTRELLSKMSDSKIKFTGLYIAAGKKSHSVMTAKSECVKHVFFYLGGMFEETKKMLVQLNSLRDSLLRSKSPFFLHFVFDIDRGKHLASADGIKLRIRGTCLCLDIEGLCQFDLETKRVT